MTIARFFVAATVAATLIATLAPAGAQTSPKPSGSPHPIALPSPHLPTHAMHAEYVVEVNKKGQVVKIKSGIKSGNQTFDLQTFGNAQQMWIRKEDGGATVGLFKVTYDYDPKTHLIARHFSLISAGGDWGDAEGAANVMMDTAKKQAAASAAAQAAAAEKARKSLPALNEITGQPTPKPSPTPTI